MKKMFAFVISCMLMVTLAACGSTTDAASRGESIQFQTSGQNSETKTPDSAAPESAPESTPQGASEPSATESAPASTPESTPVPSASESEPDPEAGPSALVVYFSWSGNTGTIANEIVSQTGADIFELTPVTPYSADYNTVLDEAQAEQRDGARPEISGSIENIGSYDVIYLGFPNWWGDMPMILYSFLDEYDLSGKTIAPFVSSGGSGFSGSISAIGSAEPGATITDGLSLSSDASKNPGSSVSEWLAKIGLAE